MLPHSDPLRTGPAAAPPQPVALILAGGQARRMGGGDKLRQMVGGVSILGRIGRRLAPQAARVLLNANGDLSRFADTQLELLPDPLPGAIGPLAGVLAGLDWAASHAPGVSRVLTVPGDCPFLPADLAARLIETQQRTSQPVVRVCSGGRSHPAIALWPVALRENLRQALTEEKLYKVQAWQNRHGCADAEWPVEPYDPFFNINTPDDLAAANAIAGRWPDA